jgi:hypothetical protein
MIVDNSGKTIKAIRYGVFTFCYKCKVNAYFETQEITLFYFCPTCAYPVKEQKIIDLTDL